MSQATFTIRALAEALGTEQWRLARVVGKPGGIPATRVRGTGSGGVGRGGQWRIDAEQLLDYARVPPADRPEDLGDPSAVLSKIILLSKIAEQERMPLVWARNIWLQRVWRHNLQAGTLYGRSDVLLPTVIEDEVRSWLRSERGPE